MTEYPAKIALNAERDGTIAEALVRAGSQIDGKDLLGRTATSG